MAKLSEKRITRNDIVLLLCLLLVGAGSLLFVHSFQKKPGAEVYITVDGKLQGTYRLTDDATIPIEINGETGNILVISEGKADMTDATCPDKLCVHQKSISRQGETIVCLPHKVVVEVHAKESSEFDSFSR